MLARRATSIRKSSSAFSSAWRYANAAASSAVGPLPVRAVSIIRGVDAVRRTVNRETIRVSPDAQRVQRLRRGIVRRLL